MGYAADNIRDGFMQSIQSLSGKLCWDVIGGKGTGSIITLDFGKKIPRRKPLQSKHFSMETQMYEAELSLMIYCAWRIDSEEQVVCGSNDSNEEQGPMLQGLRRLVDTTVESLDMTFPGYDLSITFSNKLRMHLFCNMMDAEVDSDNYVLFKNEDVFSVAPKSVLGYEKR